MSKKDSSRKAVTLEDIVFETRNKEYGAYWLRKRFARYLVVAFLISLIGVTGGIAVPFIKAIRDKDKVVELVEEVSTTMEVIDVEEDDLTVVAPPPPPPSATEQQISYAPPVVVDTVTVAVELAIVEDARATVINEPVPEQIIEVVEEEEEVIVEEEPAFVFVEEQATFQGGSIDDFRAWVQANIVYPPLAIENNIFGRVTVQFAVNSRGEVVDVVIIRGVDPSLDEETKRVILSSPKWVAAKQGGRAVKQQFTIPVVFQLTQ